MKARVQELPAGYRWHYLEVVDSTNAEAMRRASVGEPPGLWIFAGLQRAGRGREGRDWVSKSGNLHASLILTPGCPLQTCAQLSLVAGLAALDAVRALTDAADGSLGLALKWPNDLILEGGKLGGILLESNTAAKDGLLVVIGTGLNLAFHPEPGEIDGARATDLSEHGWTIAPRDALAALAWTTDEWLQIWDRGNNFGEVRRRWLERAYGLGEKISVKHGGNETCGLFDSLDENGALLLDCGNDGLKRITVGDVVLSG